MKAIETRYKGYRFRSRLEARWAVFFDAIPLAWEYEPEGVVLPSGPYLPDFYLPRFDVWAEVKPADDTFNWPQAFELAAYKKRPVLALIGSPADTWLPIAIPAFTFNYLDGREETIPPYQDYFDIGATIGDGRFWIGGDSHYPPGKMSFDFMARAADRARGARFEHGERP